MFYFKLKFVPVWKDIAQIRNFIIAMLCPKLTDYTSAYRVALAASELIENICKYSLAGSASLELEQHTEGQDFFLRIKNITDDKHIQQFREIYEMIHQDSAMKIYKKMMLRSLERGISKQLGLSRIRYEGQADISYTVKSDIGSLLYPTDSAQIEGQELSILCIQIKTTLAPLDHKGEANGH